MTILNINTSYEQLVMIDNAVRGEVIERLLIDGFQWFFFFTNRDPTLFFHKSRPNSTAFRVLHASKKKVRAIAKSEYSRNILPDLSDVLVYVGRERSLCLVQAVFLFSCWLW